MGMMDYLIGKNVGRTEGKNQQDRAARLEAIQQRNAKISIQQDALALADALHSAREELTIMKKRFYREREARKTWQKGAEFRKLSLLKRGATESEMYAEQQEFYKTPELDNLVNEKINAESAKLDAEMGANPKKDYTVTPSMSVGSPVLSE